MQPDAALDLAVDRLRSQPRDIGGSADRHEVGEDFQANDSASPLRAESAGITLLDLVYWPVTGLRRSLGGIAPENGSSFVVKVSWHDSQRFVL